MLIKKDSSLSKLLSYVKKPGCDAKGRLYNAKRRHPDQQEEIDVLLSDLAINAPNKKEDFFNNSLSLNDFREWLNSHKQEDFK